ncbi:MAG: hypothetical protein EDS66_13875 [Planctomycetota bacterium]|nr:MAG: hypothetical protein EDS66_13875 [Planctomycetota bacterium]MCQ3922027.1 hypothetical protein [Planctomycetota bacterium]
MPRFDPLGGVGAVPVQNILNRPLKNPESVLVRPVFPDDIRLPQEGAPFFNGRLRRGDAQVVARASRLV